MTRPYTGWDKDASGRRAGTEKFVQLVCEHFGNKIWNNGTWVVRNARGKSSPSVHGTGRACDLSWRKKDENKGCGRYELALPIYDFLVAYADALTIEYVADYFPAPGGRAWKCDRNSWKPYEAGKIHGAPGGDWIHVELSNAQADNPQYFVDVFAGIKSGAIKPGVAAPAASPTPAKAPAANPFSFPYPGKPLKKASKGDQVKLVQAFLKIAETASFDKATEDAVKAFQTSKALKADGVVGPQTWAAMFG